MSLYRVFLPFLFLMDAERSHRLGLWALKIGLVPRPPKTLSHKEREPIEAMLKTTFAGMDFPNPIGLGAGFDKHAELPDELLALGFGHVELGTITPKPQPGNPYPRLFRAPSAEALINRFGFNSHGAEICARRVAAYFDASTRVRRGIVGVNIGKNKDTKDAATDYLIGLELFSENADYITINISSPNTPGLRQLQEKESLRDLLTRIMAARETLSRKPPLFVKVAPDLDDAQIADMAEVFLSTGVQGLIVGNTTLDRPAGLPSYFTKQVGGLSGKPLLAKSTRILQRFYTATQGKIPLIGCGGVFTAEDAYAKIRAGASLVQLYTGFIYEGPWVAAKINKGLVQLLKRDGFSNVSEAVGTGRKGV